MNQKNKRFIYIGLIALVIIGFFFVAKNISTDYFEKLGLTMPLPAFTLLIALIDGFNPCTMWVLTFLLVLLVSVSHSRKRIFAVGYTFVAVVFVIYFLFMAAWLNLFLFLGYFETIRIIIGIVAIVAGIINCKEFFWFREGVTLMIQEQHKAPLVNKIESMKQVIKKGSMPALIISSVILAAFASIVELPCTAGWPLIYTNILAQRGFENTVSYYIYLLLYNAFYIIPISAIIFLFGYTFKGKQITKDQMKIIKFIGGFIMILLGIILLVNPELLILA